MRGHGSQMRYRVGQHWRYRGHRHGLLCDFVIVDPKAASAAAHLEDWMKEPLERGERLCRIELVETDLEHHQKLVGHGAYSTYPIRHLKRYAKLVAASESDERILHAFMKAGLVWEP